MNLASSKLLKRSGSHQQMDPNPKSHKKSRKSNYILIQKYLKDPLLFDGRKFDLRCYALVLKTPQCFRAFWFKHGYARTSSYKYELASENDNLMMHLTNEAIQVKSRGLKKIANLLGKATFGKFEDGNKVYFDELEKYFEENEPIFKSKNLAFKKDIIPQLKVVYCL